MIYLTLPDLLHVAERTLGAEYAVRDYGLLEAALARPQATAFGKDAYPDLDAKAAALLHSVARNHALVDGNKRLALAAVIAFYGLNGRRLILTNDQAYDLVISVAAGELDDANAIAAILRNATQRRLSDAAQPHAQAPDRRLGAQGDRSVVELTAHADCPVRRRQRLCRALRF